MLKTVYKGKSYRMDFRKILESQPGYPSVVVKGIKIWILGGACEARYKITHYITED